MKTVIKNRIAIKILFDSKVRWIIQIYKNREFPFDFNPDPPSSSLNIFLILFHGMAFSGHNFNEIQAYIYGRGHICNDILQLFIL